jgi:TolB-like protein/Flp pilus assembly protein TadD
MPHDIFISYSRKDKESADELAELLASAGLSVWIDRQGIVGAEKWATEIVEGIKGCSTFILLISNTAVQSENVLRELSLASETRKRILPVEIERIELPSSFMYPLAGLQHVKITDFDKIVHAHKHGVEKVIKKDERKSLMILPFEDLSPTGDNGWFADGIVSELISALSNVKSIRIADNQATKEFKKYQGQLTTYAREMNFRYFVQGDVRKFGDNIKITARLLDIESGDHLWQESMKGTMENIFDFQEEVALKVVEGLKVHLASDEKKKLIERGTENAEAYELYMKASEYFNRQTKEGMQLAVQLSSEAIKLDTSYARAFHFKANALAALYRRYDRTPALLDEAETLSLEALRLKPDLFAVFSPLSVIYLHRSQLAEAEEAVREYVRKDPENWHSHSTLGSFYRNTEQYSKAIAPAEEAVRLKPDDLVNLWNLVVTCNGARELEKCSHWAGIALPYFERHLKLHPDDEAKRVWHACLLSYNGRTDDAHAAAMKLTNLKDGSSLYNTACLFARLGDKTEALRTYRKAIEAGYKDIRLMKKFLAHENEGIAFFAGTPGYEEVKRMVEKLSEP